MLIAWNPLSGETLSASGFGLVQEWERFAGAASTAPDPTYISLRPIYLNLTAFDALRIINEALTDTPVAATPNPVTWETDSPVGLYDWSAITIAVDQTGQARTAGGGATLISPSFAVIGDHFPSTNKYYWMTPGGVEVERTAIATTNIAGDLTVIQLSSAINNIDPLPILVNSAVMSGRQVICLEHDRHLNTRTVNDASLSAGTLTNDDTQVAAYRPTGQDDIETGDSGKPVLAIIDGQVVLVGTAVSGTGSGAGQNIAFAPNPSHYIDEITAIVNGGSESLTLAVIGGGGGGGIGGGIGGFRSAITGTFSTFTEEED